MAMLEIENLTVEFKTGSGLFRAVDGVSLTIDAGEVLAIVGESGSGKSVAMLAVMGLLPWTAKVTADRMAFEGQDLLNMSANDRRRIIGKDIAMIFQEPMTSLNPCFTVGFQITEALKTHLDMDKAARRRAGHRAARPRRHSGAGAAALGLPAPALGRHEPARDDRHGHRLQSQAADRRRADHRARCHHPGADPRPAGEAAEGHRHGPRAHHPLHGRGGRDGRARQRAICRPEGGGAAGEGSLRRSAPSLHRGPALGPARARQGAAPALHSRRRARPVRPAQGLPVRAALQLRHRALPQHGAAAHRRERCATIRWSRACRRAIPARRRRHEHSADRPRPDPPLQRLARGILRSLRPSRRWTAPPSRWSAARPWRSWANPAAASPPWPASSP